ESDELPTKWFIDILTEGNGDIGGVMQPPPEADAAAFLFCEGKREPRLLLQVARGDTANSQQKLHPDPRRRSHKASDMTKASSEMPPGKFRCVDIDEGSVGGQNRQKHTEISAGKARVHRLKPNSLTFIGRSRLWQALQPHQ